ncbi:hypothetical protein CHI12_09575 [Terribacillus saccharophilus]|jgi:hypothetical protein|uniref:Uncharacterized protein n=1 Tax=Terribacillus saccharophilus TaxID=361277 RepID=A0A268HCL1_9BACI|nr:hypothetical protein CHI12_09575 [Terribacillus saccharophilus]
MNKVQGLCPSLIINIIIYINTSAMQKNTKFFLILLAAAAFIAYNIYGGVWLNILSAGLAIATLIVAFSDLFKRKGR